MVSIALSSDNNKNNTVGGKAPEPYKSMLYFPWGLGLGLALGPTLESAHRRRRRRLCVFRAFVPAMNLSL